MVESRHQSGTIMELRHYQVNAVNAVLSSLAAGDKSGLLVMATGTGKSVVMAEVAEQYIRQYRRPVLVIAHRQRLITQLDRTFDSHGLHVAIEMAEQRAHDIQAEVVIASVPSLARESRRRGYHAERFGLVLVDESHHSSAVSHGNILSHFKNAYHLGVTATPDRADGEKLPFDKVLFEYRLTTAIKEEYLCPIMAELVPIRIDMTKVKVQMGDFQDKAIDAALMPYLNRIADEIASRKEKHLVFLPLVKTSVYMAKLLNDRGLKTAHLDGTSNDVDDTIRRYEAGELDCLTNALLFTEGVDIPCVSCITNLRITKSRGTYSQIVGRGTRLHPSKERLLLLDFLFHSKRHRICTPASLVGDDTKKGEQITQMVERKVRGGRVVNILEESEIALDQINRSPSLVREIRQHEHKKRELINPLDDKRSEGYNPLHPWQNDPATENQLAYLKRQGYNVSNMTKGLASHLIDQIINAPDATPAQIKLLQSRGKWIPGMSKHDASEMIEKLLGKYK